jgi:hypothetical protein
LLVLRGCVAAKSLHRNGLTDNLLDIGSCAPSSSCNLISAFILLHSSFDSEFRECSEHAERVRCKTCAFDSVTSVNDRDTRAIDSFTSG